MADNVQHGPSSGLGLLFPGGRFVDVHSLGPGHAVAVGRFLHGIEDPAFSQQQFSAHAGEANSIVVQCQGPNRAPTLLQSDLLS